MGNARTYYYHCTYCIHSPPLDLLDSSRRQAGGGFGVLMMILEALGTFLFDHQGVSMA